MSPVPDLDLWDQIRVPVTHSAELQNLERHAEYAIAVAARTGSVSVSLMQLMYNFLQLTMYLKTFRERSAHSNKLHIYFKIFNILILLYIENIQNCVKTDETIRIVGPRSG